MLTFIHHLEAFVQDMVLFFSLLIEIWGIVLILIAVYHQLTLVVKTHSFNFKAIAKDEAFNHALSVALEVLLASEILKTMTAGSPNELIHIGVLCAIRIAMSVMLMLEGEHKIKHKQHEPKHYHVKKRDHQQSKEA